MDEALLSIDRIGRSQNNKLIMFGRETRVGLHVRYIFSVTIFITISFTNIDIKCRQTSEEMANRCLVFVYGTLKRGEPNHHWLTDAANGNGRFIGRAVTSELFPLVVASRYNIPFLLNSPGSGKVRYHQSKVYLCSQ